MAYEQGRHGPLLHILKNFESDLPNLANASRSRLQICGKKRLDGIKDQRVRLNLLNHSQNILNTNFGADQQIIGQCPQTIRPQFYLRW